MCPPALHLLYSLWYVSECTQFKEKGWIMAAIHWGHVDQKPRNIPKSDTYSDNAICFCFFCGVLLTCLAELSWTWVYSSKQGRLLWLSIYTLLLVLLRINSWYTFPYPGPRSWKHFSANVHPAGSFANPLTNLCAKDSRLCPFMPQKVAGNDQKWWINSLYFAYGIQVWFCLQRAL